MRDFVSKSSWRMPHKVNLWLLLEIQPYAHICAPLWTHKKMEIFSFLNSLGEKSCLSFVLVQKTCLITVLVHRGVYSYPEWRTSVFGWLEQSLEFVWMHLSQIKFLHIWFQDCLLRVPGLKLCIMDLNQVAVFHEVPLFATEVGRDVCAGTRHLNCL